MIELLARLKKTLIRLFVIGPEAYIDHPFFGRMGFFPSKNGDYWECSLVLDGNDLSIMVDAGAAGPSPAQEEFARNILADPGVLFEKVKPLLSLEYERWLRRPLAGSGEEAFALSGFTVPKSGDVLEPWDVSYECPEEPGGHLFTAYFEAGKASHTTVDG